LHDLAVCLDAVNRVFVITASAIEAENFIEVVVVEHCRREISDVRRNGHMDYLRKSKKRF
jgi:hypothetical protein